MSAFQKSMRGSDPDAAVHYLGRLLEAGDLPSVCRRLLVCACEDVGLAWPQIIPVVKAAVDSALMVGLPEARIPLADAAVLVALAPKSNSAYKALDAALADIRAGKAGPVPRGLQNKHYDSAEVERKGQFYQLSPRRSPSLGCPSSICPIPCWEPTISTMEPARQNKAFGLIGTRLSISPAEKLYDGLESQIEKEADSL